MSLYARIKLTYCCRKNRTKKDQKRYSGPIFRLFLEVTFTIVHHQEKLPMYKHKDFEKVNFGNNCIYNAMTL